MVESGCLTGACRHVLGLGAGPDRGGSRLNEAVDAGFAFVELGTVTPRPEPEHNPGADALAARMAAYRTHPGLYRDCVVGVNFGSQFASPPESIASDWREAFTTLAAVSDFVTINLSAPYYASLLQMQNLACIVDALGSVARQRDQQRPIPLLVKLPFGRKADDACVAALLPQLAASGVNGIVVSTVSDALTDVASHIQAAVSRGKLPIIATGGVRTGDDLLARLAAGADLVQIYSVFANDDVARLHPLINTALSVS